MLGVAYVVSSITAAFAVLGTHVTPCLPHDHTVRWTETAMLSVPLGLTTAALMSLVLAHVRGGLDPSATGFVCVAMAAVALAHAPRLRARLAQERKLVAAEARLCFPLFVVLGVWALLFGYLLHTHMLREENQRQFTSLGVYGDLPFHLQLVYSFTSGANKAVDVTRLSSTFYAHKPLVYPYLPDFQSAVLVDAGLSLRSALVLPSFLLAVSLLGLVFVLNLRITRNFNAALLSLFACVFCGGLAWTALVYPKWQFYPTVINKVDHMQKDINNKELFWWSLIVHILLPQRNSLYAYPMFAGVVGLLAAATTFEDRAFVRSRLVLFVTAGLAVALMPLLQPHSLVSCGLVAATYCVLNVDKVVGNKHMFLSWLACAAPAVLLGVPQCGMYISHSLNTSSGKGTPFIGYDPVFGNANFLTFWWDALGLFGPVCCAAVVLLRTRHAVSWYLSFFSIFAVANLVRFQPWKFDNLKMLYLWAFGAAGGVGLVLETLRTVGAPSGAPRDEVHPAGAEQSASSSQANPSKKGASSAKKPPSAPKNNEFQFPDSWEEAKRMFSPEISAGRTILVLVVLLAMSLSSVLCLVKVLPTSYQFYSQQDLEFAAWVRDNVEPDAVMLASSDHRQPAVALTGRESLIGYEGWLWTHGINYHPRKRQVMDMWGGKDTSLKLFKEYKCRYIARGGTGAKKEFDRQTWGAQDPFLSKHATKVYDKGGWQLFNITSLRF